MRIPKDQAALLVIDMQNGFVHPESGMGKRLGQRVEKSRSGTAAQQAIVPSILKLAERFRAQGVPVIWSQ
ncbi:MAG TPA: isochorismatase family protein, partial [Bdellovibrionota bacterium]|nr:isochorismatase family protein [Bdellovibrionota bacterium]